jgi:hypothetical protein
MTTLQEPPSGEVQAEERPTRTQVLRLYVRRILHFSQANALLQRLLRLPGVRRITLNGVSDGVMVVDISSGPPAGIERNVQYLWADFPGTTLHRLNNGGDVTEIEVLLGRRVGS